MHSWVRLFRNNITFFTFRVELDEGQGFPCSEGDTMDPLGEEGFLCAGEDEEMEFEDIEEYNKLLSEYYAAYYEAY